MKSLSPARSFPRLLLFALVLTLSGASYAAEPESCGAAGPAIFNVFQYGTITVGINQNPTGEACNASFQNSETLNVGKGNGEFLGPTNPACPVKPSGINLGQLSKKYTSSTTQSKSIKVYNYNLDPSKPGVVNSFAINSNGTDHTYYACELPNGNMAWSTTAQWDNVSKYTCKQSETTETVIDLPGVFLPQPPGSTNPVVFKNTTGNEHYSSIESWGAPIYFDYDPSDPQYVIDTFLTTNVNNMSTFEPGTYNIKTLKILDQSILYVAASNNTLTGSTDTGLGDGSGVVKFYVLNDPQSELIGNNTCINIPSCNPSNNASIKVTSTAGLDASKMQFYFDKNDFGFGNVSKVAAFIYLNDGKLSIHANSGTTIVGEVLAKSISTGNNNEVNFIYQDTGALTELYRNASGTIASAHEGYYQLAPTAHPKFAAKDELAFIPYQTDYLVKDDGSIQKRGGHVQAFAYNADGTTGSTPTWDAASMTKAQREAKLYVTNSSDLGVGLFTGLDATNDATFNVADDTSSQAVETNVLQGPAVTTETSGQWETIIGQPNSTKPLIYKNEVIFSTSDGFVYAVNRKTGELNWGWMPREFLYGLAGYKTFIEGDPMQGQLVGIPTSGLLEDPNSTDKSGIILGTAKGGALHYALSLSSSGGLEKVLWMDARKASDVGDNGTATLYADLTGTSPNAAEQVVYSSRTLYIVNNIIITRKYADGSDVKSITPGQGITLTSTPLIALQDRKDAKNMLYVGDSKGDIYTANMDSNNPSLAKLDVATGVSFGEVAPIKYLTYTRMGDYEYLTAQSDTRLTVFKRQISDAVSPATNKWQQAWTTDDAGTQAASVDHVQTIPTTATFSARVSVAGGVVSAPVSEYNTTTCLADGYVYFFNLEDGQFPMGKVKYLGTTAITGNKQLGLGLATESTIQAFGGALSLQSQSEQNLPGVGGVSLPGADDRFEILGNTLIERRGWREIYE